MIMKTTWDEGGTALRVILLLKVLEFFTEIYSMTSG